MNLLQVQAEKQVLGDLEPFPPTARWSGFQTLQHSTKRWM